MSLSRQFFREMRPLFRMLESPFNHSTRRFPVVSRGSGLPSTHFESAFAPFGMFEPLLSSGLPAIDVKEESSAFVVEAEMPGVKKDNVTLSIGDDSQSVTIEGRTVRGTAEQPAEVESKKPEASTGDSDEQQLVNSSTTISSERVFAGESSFSRTIWLPRRVDPSGVSAKLQDGILTVRIPKAEEQAGVKINIE